MVLLELTATYFDESLLSSLLVTPLYTNGDEAEAVRQNKLPTIHNVKNIAILLRIIILDQYSLKFKILEHIADKTDFN